jgi:hypothetical protein
VGETTVRRAKKLIEEAPDLAEEVKQGRLTVHGAHRKRVNHNAASPKTGLRTLAKSSAHPSRPTNGDQRGTDRAEAVVAFLADVAANAASHKGSGSAFIEAQFSRFNGALKTAMTELGEMSQGIRTSYGRAHLR